MANPTEPRCELCGTSYADGGDGYAGLCPMCADATDVLIEDYGHDEDEAREIVERMPAFQQERALILTPGVERALDRLLNNADLDAMNADVDTYPGGPIYFEAACALIRHALTRRDPRPGGSDGHA